MPRPERFAELLGRPLTEMRIEDGGGNMTIAHLPEFNRVDPRAEMVPFDVAGEITNPTPRTSPTFVAVAVNGTIRAVTRTWSSEPNKWLATPPLDVWREGANDLQVFVVDAGCVALSSAEPVWCARLCSRKSREQEVASSPVPL